MDYSTLNDAQLIALIIEEHEQALSTLYDRHHRLVYNLALTVVTNQSTAEEITLDVFMRVWNKAGSYQPDKGKVLTWLTRITRNTAISFLRRKNEKLDLQSTRWIEEEFNPVSKEGLPEEKVELLMQQERVHAALGQLSQEQKEVLILAYFKGYSHQQIAKELKQPLGTVKTRIRLTMQQLKVLLKDEQIL